MQSYPKVERHSKDAHAVVQSMKIPPPISEEAKGFYKSNNMRGAEEGT